MTRKTLIEQRRPLLMAMVIFLAFCAVPGLWAGYFGVITNVGGFVPYIFFTGIACAYAASKSFGELARKENSISLLMIPSTVAEKFWPRVLASIFGTAILVALGWIVVGLTNNLMIGLRYGMWLPGIYNPFADADGETYLAALALFLFYAAAQSLFVLGSIVWSRHSFLKSFAVLILLVIAWLFTMYGLSKLLVEMEVAYSRTRALVIQWSITAFILAVCVTLLVVAYKRLKTKQIA